MDEIEVGQRIDELLTAATDYDSEACRLEEEARSLRQRAEMFRFAAKYGRAISTKAPSAGKET